MPSSSRWPWCAVGVLWLLLSALGLHGFSLAQWHQLLDGSPESEVLVGHSQTVRSDDYLAVLPQLLAQRAHEPRFPAYHTGIGDGRYDMVFNFAAPVRHWSTLFRPQVWGYFVGADFGVAFHWWFNVFGTGAAVFLLLRRVASVEAATALAGAAAFLFSPFVQFWSLNGAPALLFASLSLLSLDAVAGATERGALRLATAAAVWSLAALLLTFSFVPYLVSLVWLMAFLLPALVRADVSPRLPAVVRVAAGAAAVACAAAVLAALAHEHAETLSLIRSSAYPGHRLDAGGNESWARVLRGNFYTFFPPLEWGGLSNVCAGSGFPLFFPLVLGLTVLDAAARRCRPDAVVLAVAAALALLLCWSLAGFPAWLARATLFERVPPRRAQLAVGLADTLLLGWYLGARLCGSRSVAHARWQALVLLPAWFGLHLIVGRGLADLTPGYPAWQAVASGSIMTGFGALLILRPRAFWPVLALALFGLTASFNPLARGGTEFIAGNRLSRAIVAADAAARDAGVAPLWAAFGDGEWEIGTGNLFRMLGVRSVGGVNSVEQPRFWRVLDPGGAQSSVYRRYAHVVFVCPEDPGEFAIRLVQTDLVAIHIHPANPLLGRLGLTHIVYTGRHPERLRRRGLQRLDTVAGKTLYHLARQP